MNLRSLPRPRHLADPREIETTLTDAEVTRIARAAAAETVWLFMRIAFWIALIVGLLRWIF